MTEINNLRKATPHHSDKYFIDTNVWFWVTYAASNEIETPNAPLRYQLQEYPAFIEKILDEGACIYHSPLTLSELTNIVEKTEYDIYKEDTGEELTRKQFRMLPELRARVMGEVSNAWKQITQMSESLDINIDANISNKALDALNKHCLDAYDAFYIESMAVNQITKIVTDDSDFNGLDLSLYTANNRLVRQ